MKRLFLLLTLTVLTLSACAPIVTSTEDSPPTQTHLPPTVTPDSGLTDIPLPAGYGVRGSWFELYFTNPSSSWASQRTGGPDGHLATAIDDAHLTVDVAIYSISLDSIRDALLRAHNRGVQVRVVMESDNRDSADAQVLEDAGITVLGDRRQGLMHNKFVVIDNSEVWMGSMNFTNNGGYDDNNNLMRIHSVKVAEDYTKEFEEMFIDDKFGPDVVAATPNPRVTINGTPLDIYFSPDDHVASGLIDLLSNAEESIYFMAFSFTSDELGEAIRERAQNDVTVAGVMDSDQVASNIGTEYDAFNQAGLDVYKDRIPGLMHHKVMIIDQEIVVLGSYNFTNSAETRNDENLIVIYNAEIAAEFMAEFQRVYAQVVP